MKDYIIINTPVAIAIIVLLILFGVGFCITQLLLQSEADRNRALKERNRRLREKLSVTQQELNSRGYHLPEVEGDG